MPQLSEDPLLRAALDASREAVAVVDERGAFGFFNREFFRLWGLNEEMVTAGGDVAMTQVVAQVKHPEAFLARLTEVQALVDAECFDVIEFLDGRVVERYSRPLHFDGRTSGRIWCFLDVTARVRAEAALQASQERLVQAQKMEVVGRLAGGIAHDFNNLLTIIGGHSQLLVERIPEVSPLHRSAVDIQRASEHAAALTGRLLAFSRKRIVQPRPVDLNQVVRELLPLVRRLLREDIHLHVRLDPGPSTVQMDPVEIEQILLNLAANARDAMPNGGVLQVFTDAGPNGEVELVVADSGTGMDKDTASRVFEPFFTTKAVDRGTGLGLATVQEILERAKGTIELQTEVGAGARFAVRLPRVVGSPSSGRGSDSRPDSAHGEKVLVVEDAADIRELVGEVLSDAGYRVLPAADGAEALALASKERVDLVLCDIVLPRLSGIELVHRLRQSWPGVPVLFMSGYADVVPGHESLPDGASHIAKPFRLEALLRRVGEMLNAG